MALELASTSYAHPSPTSPPSTLHSHLIFPKGNCDCLVLPKTLSHPRVAPCPPPPGSTHIPSSNTPKASFVCSDGVTASVTPGAPVPRYFLLLGLDLWLSTFPTRHSPLASPAPASVFSPFFPVFPLIMYLFGDVHFANLSYCLHGSKHHMAKLSMASACFSRGPASLLVPRPQEHPSTSAPIPGPPGCQLLDPDTAASAKVHKAQSAWSPGPPITQEVDLPRNESDLARRKVEFQPLVVEASLRNEMCEIQNSVLPGEGNW